MFGHVLVCRVNIRLIPAGRSDCCFSIVRNQDLRHTAKVLKRTHMASNPRFHGLGLLGLGIGMAAGAQSRHKHRSFTPLSSLLAKIAIRLA